MRAKSHALMGVSPETAASTQTDRKTKMKMTMVMLMMMVAVMMMMTTMLMTMTTTMMMIRLHYDNTRSMVSHAGTCILLPTTSTSRC